MTSMTSKVILKPFKIWTRLAYLWNLVHQECLPNVAKRRYGAAHRDKSPRSQLLGVAVQLVSILPPFIIYAAKQLNYLWTQDEVSGTRYGVSDKGWVDQGIFYLWLKDHVFPNAVSWRPLLLLLDRHSSHFEPQSIQFAKDNEIIIFCVPPHTTHEC